MKEVKEFEELQEFKNGNASKNAVIRQQRNRSRRNSPSLRYSITPFLYRLLRRVVARAGAVKTPTTTQPIPKLE